MAYYAGTIEWNGDGVRWTTVAYGITVWSIARRKAGRCRNAVPTEQSLRSCDREIYARGSDRIGWWNKPVHFSGAPAKQLRLPKGLHWPGRSWRSTDVKPYLPKTYRSSTRLERIFRHGSSHSVRRHRIRARLRSTAIVGFRQNGRIGCLDMTSSLERETSAKTGVRWGAECTAGFHNGEWRWDAISWFS